MSMEFSRLKRILNSSFSFRKGELFLDDQQIYLLQLRHTKRDVPDLVRDELEGFVTSALKEKRERIFGESLRWEKARHENYYKCPKCLHEREFTPAFIYMSGFYNYCPNCGQKLDPPEKEKK
jgi:transcription initiation factor IIE alpha subunit